MKRIITITALALSIFLCKAQPISQEKMLDRLLRYLKIESQSIDDPDPNSFPLTEGQRNIARLIYDEVRSFGGNAKVTLSDDYYLYVDIPSNMKRPVPSILLLAHLDVTPEANGKGINPQVHFNYNGGDIVLKNGVTLSPNTPQGAHLKDLVGKTIITSDGTTILGADDKAGTCALITLVEELLTNPQLRHGRVMVCLSQNEDVGKASVRYQPEVFGDRPDIVIDVDGDTFDKYSIACFTAESQTYYFSGNLAHPGHGKENRFGDALTAASYFVGQIPPTLHPSASEGVQGYIHCYSMEHPTDSAGRPIASDVILKVRLRYFDNSDGVYQRQLLADNLRKTREAFPFVEITKTSDVKQYENVGKSMAKYVPAMVQKAASDAGMPMQPKYSRGGTTSAMLVARYPEAMPGGVDLYSGQNSEHTVYEWCCLEELHQIVNVCKNILTKCSKVESFIEESSVKEQTPPTQKSLRKLPHGVD